MSALAEETANEDVMALEAKDAEVELSAQLVVMAVFVEFAYDEYEDVSALAADIANDEVMPLVANEDDVELLAQLVVIAVFVELA